jgi:hypothetical protein
MAEDMAILHSQSALLRRAVSGWRKETANAVCERECAQRRTAMWSKVHTWLQQPDAESDPILSTCTSTQPDSSPCFTQAATQSMLDSSRQVPRGNLARIQSNERDGCGSEAGYATVSGVSGLTQTFVEELERILDLPPQLDVNNSIVDPVQSFSRYKEACPSPRELPVDLALQAPSFHPSLRTSPSIDGGNPIEPCATIMPENCIDGVLPPYEEHSSTVTTEDQLKICDMETSAQAEQSKRISSGRTKGSTKSCGTPQPRIHKAIHEKLAKFVSRPNYNRAALNKAVEKMHKFLKQPEFVHTTAEDSGAVDASSVEATPLRPTLRTGRHAKVINVPKWAIPGPEQSNSFAHVEDSSTGICGAHKALTEGFMAPLVHRDDADSDDEFAWIMHRQLPRV